MASTTRPRTVRGLVDAYAAVRLRRAAANTRWKYQYVVDHWADVLEREPELCDLNDEAIGELQDYLLDTVALSDCTVRGYISKMLCLWRFAHQQRWRDEWPMVELIVPAERIPTAWTAEQLRTLWAALKAQPGFIGGIPAAGWWTAQHCVFWDSLGRLNEVLKLRRADIDLSGATAIFRASTRKGRRRDVMRGLHPRTIEAIREIWEPKRDLLLPFPYYIGTLHNRYKALLREAGLPCDRSRMFHCLRRSAASHLEAAGVSATALLDHSDRAITLKHYIDPRISRGVQAAEILFRPDAPPDPPRAA